MCYLFIQHTSASLVVSENYDPTARLDLEAFMDRMAPENQSWHRHRLEGPDDSPSHMRAMLTGASLSMQLVPKIVLFTTAIFFLPSLILGMITPLAIRLALPDVRASARPHEGPARS